MTQRTSRNIKCKCGHVGSLDCSESDSPYSSLWESYSLSGFSGEEIVITAHNKITGHILNAMKPKCPACGKIGEVTYA